MSDHPTLPSEPVTPRPAATVLLLRDGPDGLEVFMVVRHHEIDFASGALVFPGGRLETADHLLAADPALCSPVAGVDAISMAFRVAALRETFEECGILLARSAGSDNLLSKATLARVASAYQGEVLRDASAFSDTLRREGLMLAPDLLVPFAHWITPVTQRKRYDTLFLMAQAPADQFGVHDGHESVDSVWITPGDALAKAAGGHYKLVFATQMNLRKLARHATAADALSNARNSTVVTVLPEVIMADGSGRHIRVPAAADYGGELFSVDLPPAI